MRCYDSRASHSRMTSGNRFARRVFLVAGVYGVIVLLPQYFLEGQIGRDYPPPITHPEHFYGFIGVALTWQLVFLVIARDVRRYRLLMLPAILEKLSFGIAAIVLYVNGRVAPSVAAVASIDLVLAVLFTLAYRATRSGPLGSVDRLTG
jgi:hypothetical protein